MIFYYKDIEKSPVTKYEIVSMSNLSQSFVTPKKGSITMIIPDAPKKKSINFTPFNNIDIPRYDVTPPPKKTSVDSYMPQTNWLRLPRNLSKKTNRHKPANRRYKAKRKPRIHDIEQIHMEMGLMDNCPTSQECNAPKQICNCLLCLPIRLLLFSVV